MKIDEKDYGGGASRVALEPRDFGGKKFSLLTISAVDPAVKIPDASRPGGARTVCVLSFEEFEGDDDRALYLNRTQVKFLIAKYGRETDRWVGQKVPLEVVTVNDVQTGKPKKKVWVADPAGAWEKILPSRGRSKPAPAAPSKRGRK